MKKLFLTLIVAFFTITGGIAQNVTVEEPEFAEETLLLTSNNQGVKLSRENGTVKTKAGASLYLTGIGKVKSRLTLKGVKSTSKAVGGSTHVLSLRLPTIRLIQTLLSQFLNLRLKEKSVDTNSLKLVHFLNQRVITFQVWTTRLRNMAKVHITLYWKILPQVNMALLLATLITKTQKTA